MPPDTHTANATNAANADLLYYPNATDPPVRLLRDPKKFSVRFGLARSALSPEAQNLLRKHAAPLTRVDHYGIIVYELGSEPEQQQAVQVLNRERDIEIAAPVMHRGRQENDDVYLTRRFIVQFWPEVGRQQIDALNAKYGVRIISQLDYAPNGYVLLAPAGADGTGAVEAANAYRASGLTVFSHPDLISRRHKRDTATSPATRAERDARATRDADYLGRQWHLATARVNDAWTLTRGVPSIAVAILDDGIDVDHPEFAGKLCAGHDFSAGVDDPRPKSGSDNHGTACAGVAVAKGVRASGAAPGCSLIAARFPASLGDADEAAMFKWAADNGADVISCSWGPADGTGSVDPLPGSTQAAIAYCVHQGRGGKGIPVCFAAGNGDESVDLDGYASNPDVIAVAASNDQERRAWYSDHGNAVWICAPSSGDRDAGEKSVLTADRHGPDGYNNGGNEVDADYTATFGGTSSASPLVAGIIGLMLSANPDLTQTQVRDILRRTARKIDGGYDADGHSPEYGYGRVDACDAVRAALAAASDGPVIALRPPRIDAPASFSRGGPPPSFDIDPGDGAALYYAVEIATRHELFDDAAHGQERSPSSFYASWQDSPLLASNPYVMPEAAWARLCSADTLYYRAWFSSSADGWTDVAGTLDDADHAGAPSLALTGAAVRDAPLRARRDAVNTHAGFDRLAYPGDDVMRALWQHTNLAWTGFYLAPSPSQGYTGWMSKAATLRQMGWGLAPVYVGQQWPGGPGSHILGSDQGRLDAADAIRLADQAGIGDNAVIYLDIEVGGLLPPTMLAYAQAWIAGVRGSNYRPGVYCSFLNTAAQLRENNPDVFFWVFNINKFAPTQARNPDGSFRTPPVADSGCPFAVAWQYIQGAPTIPVPQDAGPALSLATVDMDCATVLDPSYPERVDAAAPQAASPASIMAPQSLARADGPPQFALDPGSGAAIYYAVEVATEPELFDSANEAERDPDNFYASWETEPFQADSVYALPASAWNRLMQAERLYYRAWFSSSADAWENAVATTADADAAAAPSILLSGQAVRDAGKVERPAIDAPSHAGRDGPAPVFRLRLPAAARSFRVEVGADPAHFTEAAAPGAAKGRYASPVRPVKPEPLFALPVDAWDALRLAPRLYYRVCVSSRRPGAAWRADDSSTPDAVLERLPWIDIVPGEADRLRGIEAGVRRSRSGRPAPLDNQEREGEEGGEGGGGTDPDEAAWRRRPRAMPIAPAHQAPR
ncbi:Serine protease, subtilisin family [Noviherbaspirillum humi]|uniref:Serine protease, subtilisin family n=1 Tax=Noviherbaspirillum humi TaxID=1688639 RepID=A0A239JQI6_9BURK|nr:S8 family serine peptidase [Noviherbaspirillum humi]SNT07034.1 Serine protease, subtilisin family [Noviherbaspirillum humi]